MKTIILLFLLSLSFLHADRTKELALACYSYEDIANIKAIEEKMKNGAIPKNCMLLTSNANVTVIDSSLKDPRFVKILVLDLDAYLYILKEDIIITNENKI